MNDPDREALRRKCEEIIESVRWALEPPFVTGNDYIASARQRLGNCSIGVPARLICELRDLARLEGEAPKKASLGELADACESAVKANCSYNEREARLREAAAVLRAVGEFKQEWEHVSTEEQGDKIAEKLWRSLP